MEGREKECSTRFKRKIVSTYASMNCLLRVWNSSLTKAFDLSSCSFSVVNFSTFSLLSALVSGPWEIAYWSLDPYASNFYLICTQAFFEIIQLTLESFLFLKECRDLRLGFDLTLNIVAAKNIYSTDSGTPLPRDTPKYSNTWFNKYP